MVTRDDVLAARETIGGRVHRTPVLSSASLSQRSGAHAFLKAELLQRTGSFKPRGVLNILSTLTPEQRARGVIGISAGNHAQALAYAAAVEGIDALLVMWEGASEQKVAATRGYGAAVDLSASGPTDAFARLEQLIAETGRALVHPFDDPIGIAGAGTVALELLEDVPEADTILVPVGGGGLVSGIVAAAEGRRVVAVEPELAPSLAEGLAAGRSVPVTPTSVADGLNAPFAGTNCLQICAGRVESVLLTEAEIETGMRFVYERAKLACEPSGGAGVAALLAGKVDLRPDETVVCVISGGNVAPRTASAILGRE